MSDIKERAKSETVVLLDEEYGYREWIWFPKMCAVELEAWWRALESVEPFYWQPELLPGDLFQMKEERDFEVSMKLFAVNRHYSALINDDNDSVLTRPDKSKIYHKGYVR